jgi:hypothetical protein
LSSESIGMRWRTWENAATGAPPTRWVGDSGRRVRDTRLELPQLDQQAVVLGIRDFRVVEHVIAVVVPVDLRTQPATRCCTLAGVAFIRSAAVAGCDARSGPVLRAG